jgi:hypothetical protein
LNALNISNNTSTLTSRAPDQPAGADVDVLNGSVMSELRDAERTIRRKVSLTVSKPAST